MPAIDLTAVTAFPYTRATASVGTTLQEFDLPRGTRNVRVKGSAALYVQFAGADGDSVTASGANGAYPVASLVAESFDLSPGGALRSAGKILVAAQSATATVYLVLEGS